MSTTTSVAVEVLRRDNGFWWKEKGRQQKKLNANTRWQSVSAGFGQASKRISPRCLKLEEAQNTEANVYRPFLPQSRATDCIILINNAVTWRHWIRWMCIRRRPRVVNCEPNFWRNLHSAVSYSWLKRNAIIFTLKRHRFTFSIGCTKKTTTNTFRQLTIGDALFRKMHTYWCIWFYYPGNVSSL